MRVLVSGTRLNGDTILSFDKSKIYTSVSDIDDRGAINVGTSAVTIVTVGTVAGATLSVIQRLTIHNEDATNFVKVGLLVSGAKSVYLKVLPGESISINPSVIECDDDTGAAFSAFSTVTSITLQADTAACKCRIQVF